MAKLLSRSKSEGRLGRKAREQKLLATQTFDDSELQRIPRQMGMTGGSNNGNAAELAVEVFTTHTRSFDVPRPKTSSGKSTSPKVVTEISARSSTPDDHRPKTSHGVKNSNTSLEEPNFSILNRSYTWSRQGGSSQSKSRPSLNVPQDSLLDPIYPPRSSSRQQSHFSQTVPVEIGVAIGSPTSHLDQAPPRTLNDVRSSRMYAPDALFSRSLPQHYISLELKKDMTMPNITVTGTTSSSSSVSASEKSDENQKPAGGWKKFFGKSLFSKKSSPAKSTTSSISSKDPKLSLDSLVDEIEQAQHLYQTNNKKTPLLDVDIPSVEMERYSVMFDSLLKQQLPQQVNKQTLYSRRKSQITTAGLGQKISENPEETPNLTLQPPKKENLPLGLVNKSPLWLFPATPRTPRSGTPKSPNNNNVLGGGRPRAMTTPTLTESTTTHLFAPSYSPELSFSSKKSRPESDIMPSLLMLLEEQRDKASSRSDNNKVPPTPFSIISEGSELDTPYLNEDEYDYESHPAPWVRKFDMLDDIEWEMVTHTTPLRPRTPSPTEMLTIKNNKNNNSTSNVSISSASTTIQTPEPLSAVESEETYIAKAATISIARQISISQRQLLLPVISNPERFVQKPKLTDIKRTNSTATVTGLVRQHSRAKSSAAEIVNVNSHHPVQSEGIALAL